MLHTFIYFPITSWIISTISLLHIMSKIVIIKHVRKCSRQGTNLSFTIPQAQVDAWPHYTCTLGVNELVIVIVHFAHKFEHVRNIFARHLLAFFLKATQDILVKFGHVHCIIFWVGNPVRVIIIGDNIDDDSTPIPHHGLEWLWSQWYRNCS